MFPRLRGTGSAFIFLKLASGWCDTCNGFGEISKPQINLDENASALERELAEERAHEWLGGRRGETLS